jgi:hypothetical protein
MIPDILFDEEGGVASDDDYDQADDGGDSDHDYDQVVDGSDDDEYEEEGTCVIE